MKRGSGIFFIFFFLFFMGNIVAVLSSAESMFTLVPSFFVFFFIFFVVSMVKSSGKMRRTMRNLNVNNNGFSSSSLNDTKVCPFCTRVIESSYEYCPHCGENASGVIVCEYCGHENSSDKATCEKCNGFLK